MKLHILYMDCLLVNVPITETRRHVPWLRIDVSSRWESSSNTTESRNIDYIRKRVWRLSHAVHAIDLFYRFRMRVDTLYPLTRLMFRLYQTFHTFLASVKCRYSGCPIIPSFLCNFFSS
jgi:hypothetical protein